MVRREWSKEELDILCKNIPRLKVQYVLPMLPGRSRAAIVKKAQRMAISLYTTTKAWMSIISSNPGLSAGEYADLMGVSERTARYRLHKMREKI